MISLSHLTLLRGNTVTLNDYSNALPAGGAWLLGPNGSGKTSLLRALAGLLMPLRGDVTIDDDRVFIGTPAGHDGALSAHDNLRLWCDMNGASAVDIMGTLRQAGISDVAHRPVAALSAGQQQRVALARLLCTPKRIWLLDEPFNTLDASGQAWLRELMGRHLRAGGFIICATHRVFDVAGMVEWNLAEHAPEQGRAA